MLTNPYTQKLQENVVESVEAPPPRPVARTLMIFWSIILLKCLVVGLVYSTSPKPPHLSVGWIIIPTLIFAGLVSIILVRRKV